jgi:hypothetical protein
MNDNELEHVGIPGMRWGVRKNYTGVNGSTRGLAEKDAKRHADAKMFYGKTAGTNRKLLKAEIDKKKKNIPGYEAEFNAHVDNADLANSAKKAVKDRNRIDNVAKGRSLIKGILGVTGSLTVGVATMAYSANKEKVDSFVVDKGSKLVSAITKLAGNSTVQSQFLKAARRGLKL